MKRILAISGGVDSAVMLDIFARKYPKEELIVAHFDHGIRANSGEDAEFVKNACGEYGVMVIIHQMNMGAGASEAEARAARYEFLRKVAEKYGDEGDFETRSASERASDTGSGTGGFGRRVKQAEIYTAHHLDDLTETVAINFVRGTGWRGLACLAAEGVRRPFLEDYREMGFVTPPTKKEILRYAGEHRLRFREDQTNSSDEYLRNRIRHQMNKVSEQKKQELFRLWERQKALREEIDASAMEFWPEGGSIPREWFRKMREAEALEVIRAGMERAGISATRPQMRDFLEAIRMYRSGKYFNLPEGRLVKMRKNGFSFEDVCYNRGS